MSNRLAGETSPYLLQHQDNPVDWYPWGPEALERARAEDKPILLSIGYAACHWCHVMAHESFENAEIARLMNALFVNIKVDREERPDLDSIYQHALALLGEHGGWPLTMFLTPEREPFWGGTYFPPTARYGRPGFPDVLAGISRTYQAEPERIRSNVDALRESLGQIAAAKGSDALDPGLIDNMARMAIRHVDPIQGGTLGAPKFPQPTFFKLLWRAYERHRSEPFRAAVAITLDRMCQGGIYDHLGGGFARYSTDDEWLVPHFEKMLYDNALLIDLLTEAWRATRSPLYAARVPETVAWLLREMTVTADGAGRAFASAFDADSEGEEGKFYVWTAAEIEAVLGADAESFQRAYDVTPAGNWEGHTILNRSHAPALGDQAAEARLAAMRAKLLAVRARRVPPLRDDKVLADWNGLAIAALAQAALAFGEPAWLDAARDAFRFVLKHMTREGRLHHAWRAGRLSPARILDDHANMARAALALFEATGEAAYVAHARDWLAAAETDFRDPAGGYFLSPADAADVIVRPKTIHDNATPAANGVLVEVMARLYWITGEAVWRERAEAVVRAFGGEPPESLAHASSLMIGFETLLDCRQVVIVGPSDDGATRALRRAVDEAPPSNRIVVPLAPGAALPEGHPAAGKAMQGGRPTAYVCKGPVCGLPITEPDALVKALAES